MKLHYLIVKSKNGNFGAWKNVLWKMKSTDSRLDESDPMFDRNYEIVSRSYPCGINKIADADGNIFQVHSDWSLSAT